MSLSTTTGMASNRRSILSVRQSLASTTMTVVMGLSPLPATVLT